MSVDSRSTTYDAVPSKAAPANPAAGADFTYTIPSGKRARLDAFWLIYTSDANAANRTTHLEVVVNSVIVWRYPVTAGADFANQTASRTNVYCFAIGGGSSDAADQAFRIGPLPDDYELPSGAIIRSVTTNKQATDQIAVQWILKEVPT